MEHVFRGDALNAVDAKGRLSVPAFIRQKIERRSDERLLVLDTHPELDCLVGYDSNHSAEMWKTVERARDRNDEAGLGSLAALERAADSFAAATDVPYDPSGRIILPGRLKRRGKIDGHALFIGLGDVFLIFDPFVALECPIKKIREVAEDHIADKGLTQ